MKGGIVIFAVLLMTRWIANEARRTAARKVGDDVFFPVARGVDVIFTVTALMGLSFVYFGLTGRAADRRFSVSAGLAFVLMSAFGCPKGIRFSEATARQRTWYGEMKEIPWTDVQQVIEKEDGSVLVRSARTRIEFTTYHGDRELFLQELRHHCPLVAAHLINVPMRE